MFECYLLFVSIKHCQTAVLSVYPPPGTCYGAAVTELQSILMQLSSYVKYLIIVAGDLILTLSQICQF